MEIGDEGLDSGAIASPPDRAHARRERQGSVHRRAAVRTGALLFACILAIAAALDLLFLGRRSLWMDEAYSVALARLDWGTLSVALRTREANMALYHALLHMWLRLGDTESAIRLLSVLLALGSIVAVFVLGQRLFGIRVTLLGTLLLALNTYQVRYAQEARAYSLVMLLVSLASLAFLEAIAKPTLRNWALYTATSVLAVYAHFFALFVVVAHGASLALPGRRRIGLKGFGVSAAIMILLLAPLAGFVMAAGPRYVEAIGWIPKPTVHSLYDLSCALAGGAPWGSCGRWGSRLLLALYLAAGGSAVAATATAFKRAANPFCAWRYAFLWMWCVVPIVLALGLSTFRPVFVPRYFIVCLPPLVLLASAGLMRLRSPMAVGLAALVFVAVAGNQDVRYYEGQRDRDWRAATAYVVSHGQPRDAVVFSPWYVSPPYDYYHERLRASNGPQVVSGWDASDRRSGSPSDDFLRTLPAQHPRTWLLYDRSTAPLDARATATLDRIYRKEQDLDFRGVGMTLYVAR